MGKFVSSLQHALSIISFGRIKASTDDLEDPEITSKQSSPTKQHASADDTDAANSTSFLKRSVAKFKGIFKKGTDNPSDTKSKKSKNVATGDDIPTLSDTVTMPANDALLASTMVVSSPEIPSEHPDFSVPDEMEEMADMADMSILFETSTASEPASEPDISELFDKTESNAPELSEFTNESINKTASDETDISALLDADAASESDTVPQTVKQSITPAPQPIENITKKDQIEVDSEPDQKETFFKRLLGKIRNAFKPDEKPEVLDSDTDSDEIPPTFKRFLNKKTIVVALIILSILIVSAIVAFVFWPSKKQHEPKAVTTHEKPHEKPQANGVETLESRNKKLEEEYQKLKDKNAALLEENKKLQNQTNLDSDKSEATSSSSVAKGNKPSGNVMDCAITSKESAGKTLKDCIDAYNSGNR